MNPTTVVGHGFGPRGTLTVEQPARFFEMPIAGSLPEGLTFIP